MQRVYIEEKTGKGHCLFANEDIKVGEIVFVEEPLICCQLSWNRIHKFNACDHCLKPLDTAEQSVRHLAHDENIIIPHQECCTVTPELHTQCQHCLVRYCSEDCRSVAENLYHRAICQGADRLNPQHPINVLDNMWREITGPAEDQSILLLVRLVGLIKQSGDKAGLIKRINRFCSGTRDEKCDHVVMKLIGPEYKEKLSILCDMFSNAVFDEHISDWFTTPGFQTLLSLIGRNGQGIGTSSISVWAQACENLDISEDEKAVVLLQIDDIYQKMSNEVGSLLNCEGVGLYELQSLCNHSCSSNAEIRFESNSSRLTVKALMGIPKGEEITINYLSECDQMRSRHTRQKILREMYMFTCTCDRCVEECDMM